MMLLFSEKHKTLEHDDSLNTVFHKFAEVNLTLNKASVNSANPPLLSLDLCSLARVLLQTHIR